MIAHGVPVGLGEPVFDKLEADIAHGLDEHQRGQGRRVRRRLRGASAQRGSEHRDELTPDGFKKNSAGGMLGGISSGQDILVSIALKPTSSIQVPGATIDKQGRATEIVTTGRHDPCVGLRATPIAEAMLALDADGSLPASPRAERRRALRACRCSGSSKAPDGAITTASATSAGPLATRDGARV